ncbi:MAG: hypothetical protein GY860_14820 [Desulfobacteraceae bacterium]|nr:hypothetical protein [Desulfobacteraceae bacterium]
MNSTLDSTTIKRLVDTYIKDALENLDYYINIQKSVSLEAAQAGLENNEVLQVDYKKALLTRSYKPVDHIVDDLLEGQSVDIPSRNKLSRAVLNAAIDLHDVQHDVLKGDPVPPKLNAEQSKTLVTNQESDLDPGPALSAIIESYHSDRQSGRVHSVHPMGSGFRCLGSKGSVHKALLVKGLHKYNIAIKHYF